MFFSACRLRGSLGMRTPDNCQLSTSQDGIRVEIGHSDTKSDKVA